MMRSKVIIEEETIVETIRKVRGDAFTALDFMETLRKIYPEDWKKLVERFGLFGSRRRYTVATYFSNRLDVYSQKPCSILVPFTRYKEGGFKDCQKTTEEEREVFGRPWIAVYKKKPKMGGWSRLRQRKDTRAMYAERGNPNNRNGDISRRHRGYFL